MELTLLGTGCPKADFKRFGPSNLISTKKTKLLVDCGSGVTQRLDQLNISSADIDALFLSVNTLEARNLKPALDYNFFESMDAKKSS